MAAIMNGEEKVDLFSLPHSPSQEALNRLSFHADKVRVLHMRDSWPSPYFQHLSVLKSLRPLTPHLEQLIIHPDSELPSFIPHFIELCAPPSLSTFSIAATKLPQIHAMKISKCLEVLTSLVDQGLKLQGLELDMRFDMDTVLPPALLTGLCGVIADASRLSLDAGFSSVFKYDLLRSLPRLTHLTLHDLLTNIYWDFAAKVISTYISPCLRVVAIGGVAYRGSGKIHDLLGALVKHRHTLQGLHIKPVGKTYSAPCESDLVELDGAAMLALSELHQLRKLCIQHARTGSQLLFLDASGLMPLAEAVPRLTCLAIEITTLGDQELHGGSTSALAVMPNQDLELLCIINSPHAWVNVRAIAKAIVQCWRNVYLRAPHEFSQDDRLTQRLAPEIRKWQQNLC
ncbi:hypothetical protein RSAG8_09747, partial [Rhizoctonia solani AG-8 WAC10335]